MTDRLTPEREQEIREYALDHRYTARGICVVELLAELDAVRAERDTLADELATCGLCEYEFDEPYHAKGRSRQVVCAQCWPESQALKEAQQTIAAIRAWAISSDSSRLSQSLVYKTAQEEVLDLLASAPAEKPVE